MQPTALSVGAIDLFSVRGCEYLHNVVATAQQHGTENIDKQVYFDIHVSDNRTVSAIHCADSTISLKARICPNPDGDAEVEDEDDDGSDQ